jgi:hypothetical protein
VRRKVKKPVKQKKDKRKSAAAGATDDDSLSSSSSDSESGAPAPPGAPASPKRRSAGFITMQSTVLAPVRAHFLQLCVVGMHQNGRDTHIRQMKVFGPRQGAAASSADKARGAEGDEARARSEGGDLDLRYGRGGGFVPGPIGGSAAGWGGGRTVVGGGVGECPRFETSAVTRFDTIR